MPEPLVRAVGVTKTYGDGVVTRVLKGVDLALEDGEFCALTGPSGSGKTTFLNLVGLLDRVTDGRIYLQGRDTGPLGDVERTELRSRALGFVFQFHHLLSAFTAEENVLLPLLSRHRRSRPWMHERARELLEEVGLAERIEYRVTDLSGGEQQRVAVARALVLEPLLVLADEPTGNLDTQSGARVLELLLRFNRERNTAFFIATHDPEVADRCDRVVHMVDGVVDSDTGRRGARRGAGGEA